MITRFAPSPTGRLHLGHAYSAWLAWERARSAGGQFLLRFEDIDHTRVREEYYQGIEEDLRWLGIDWEGQPWRQLSRMDAYSQAFDRLQKMGLLYPCFCTRKELAATAPQQGDGAMNYPGTCLRFDDSERQNKLKSGVSYSWRLNMEKAALRVGELTFDDSERGQIVVRPQLLGDPVLARKDIATSYHLAVVVDDAAQKVTEVIRGEDLLESTHIHRVLQVLLGFSEPQYFHHALVNDSEGKRLAKRNDSLAITTLRQEGWSAEKVLAEALAHLSV